MPPPPTAPVPTGSLTTSKRASTASTAPASTQPAYSVIQSDVNDGYSHYNALDVNVRGNYGTRGAFLASYTWSHTTDNVDPDVPSQNPNDPTQPGNAERGNAIFDQRNRLVVSGFYLAPLKIQVGGIVSLAGGLPYNLITGLTNSGDTGATTDRPIINGAIVGRNTGRGTPIYSFDPFLARAFPLFTERVQLDLRAEAFNALNHANYVGFNGTYGTGLAAPRHARSPARGRHQPTSRARDAVLRQGQLLMRRSACWFYSASQSLRTWGLAHLRFP